MISTLTQTLLSGPASLSSLQTVATHAAASLGAFAIIQWGTTRWVPRVLNHYGFTYFDWKKPWFPGLLSNLGLVVLQTGLVHLVGAGRPAAGLPFLALMSVALYGTVRLDRRFHVIPDRFQLAGLLGALGFAVVATPSGLLPTVISSGLGLGVAGLLWLLNITYEKLRKRQAMGLGDLKLLAWLGVAMGPANLAALVYGIILASLVMLPLVLTRFRKLDTTFAFGPYLVAGCVLQQFLGSIF